MDETSGTAETVSSGMAAEVGPWADRAKRRSFTAEFKRAIAAEYDAAPVGAKGARAAPGTASRSGSQH